MSHLFHWPGDPQDPTTWVFLALITFLVLVVWLKLPQKLVKALDDRAEAIRAELDHARQLREEAQEVLAAYQRRQTEAEEEAKAIVDQARKEADLLAAEMRNELSERLERRSAMAEAKIAQAEADALASVRGKAANLAAEAAALVLREELPAASQRTLIENAIADVKERL